MPRTAAKKVVLISGGTGGLGKAVAELLAHDHAVTVFDLKPERVRSKFAKLGITTLGADIRHLDDVNRVVRSVTDAHGRIDILINNAGVLYQGALEEHSEEAIRDIFETNILGAVFLTRAVLPHMRPTKHGRIINNRLAWRTPWSQASHRLQRE